MRRAHALLIAMSLLTTQAAADCSQLPGLLFATDKEFVKLRLGLATHDHDAVCKAGAAAFQNESALYAFLVANPDCAPPDRREKERQKLKDLVFNLNDFCNAHLPPVEEDHGASDK